MRTDDFDFFLPPDLIAQEPPADRTASRLLHLEGRGGSVTDRVFRDLPSLVVPGDVVVLNDTRVLKARLMGRKKNGGRVEVLVERVVGQNEAVVHIRASHAPRADSTLVLADNIEATVIGKEKHLYRLRFEIEEGVLAMLERHGALPLPPYIDRVPTAHDEVRYQTVYARQPGAVAAPTAGLHFDETLLAALSAAGVAIAYITLHVGAGTFQPVRVGNVQDHVMHSEWYEVPDATVTAIHCGRANGGRVLAIGTTTLRALEGAAAGGELEAGSGETDIFIVPGYRFRVVERLITNFHLPRSTLLMLVSAFGGIEPLRRAYAHAIRERYRFFSYGDAMLIEGNRTDPPLCQRLTRDRCTPQPYGAYSSLSHR
jgi:S-adenosylmethionine:tRNA ribosyltransferase-isomerase